MTTLSELLAAQPDLKEVAVVTTDHGDTVTTKFQTIEIDAKFRTQMALINAFENYVAAIVTENSPSDERIQDMIDHSLGELKFTVEVDAA